MLGYDIPVEVIARVIVNCDILLPLRLRKMDSV
jgi:hypothetical protein